MTVAPMAFPRSGLNPPCLLEIIMMFVPCHPLVYMCWVSIQMPANHNIIFTQPAAGISTLFSWADVLGEAPAPIALIFGYNGPDRHGNDPGPALGRTGENHISFSCCLPAGISTLFSGW
jgi:hypothetical protein